MEEKLLHSEPARIICDGQLWGLDKSDEGICIRKGMGFESLICADVEEMVPELRDMEFEVILAGEILEHLSDPSLFLENLYPS